MSDRVNPRGRSIWIAHLLRTLRNLETEQCVQKYFVRRGAIDWGQWRWPLDFAVSVRLAENFPATGNQPPQTTLSLNVGMKIPTDTDPEEINDVMLEQVEFDMVDAVRSLCRATRDGSADNLILDQKFEGSVEWHNTDFTVQGYACTFSILY